MSKMFAIKGHSTRGREVIQILEMLGGINKYRIGITKTNCDLLYTMRKDDNVIIGTYPMGAISETYTLEQFLKKFPYKVGDKVQGKEFESGDPVYTIERMKWENGHVVYIVTSNGFTMSAKAEHLQPYKEEPKKQRKYPELRLDPSDDDKLATEVTWDGIKMLPPDGYLIGKITEVDNGLLVEFAKKPPVPKICPLDLREILKNVPKGTILYSTTHGNIRFDGIDESSELYPVNCHDIHGTGLGFTEDGRWHCSCDGECIIFPSKDQRDWSKFDLTKTGK